MTWRTSLLFVALGLLGACSSDPALPRPTTTTAATTTTGVEKAIVEAAYGCGPADAAEVRVTGRSMGTDEVVIEVAFDGTVYDQSRPMTGPRVGQVFETQLPQEAFDAGSADVRIVAADRHDEVIAEGKVDLDGGVSCG